MDVVGDANRGIRSVPLDSFSTFNVLGITCVLKLDYSSVDGAVNTVQLSLSIDQCRAMAQQLLSQANVLEYERPSSPQ